MIRSQKEGVDVCLTVTHLDSLVMARSGFHHSVNYRAVMAFGKAHVIDAPEEKLKLMDRFIDRIYPGRSKLIRQPNKQEFKATTMIGMEIETASGKIRDKHVADEEEDYEGVPAWSALYPVTQVLGEPSDCARQLPGLETDGRLVWAMAGAAAAHSAERPPLASGGLGASHGTRMCHRFVISAASNRRFWRESLRKVWLCAPSPP